ncbi:CDP-alcohol phosphatidyltransferase family protein, partial [Bacillus kwashiorkori]|uniref:CDP-alcohol phosphatidyltransferase family protein n=1 Tax=Bacillus kwashiorkori TaxID=1522318 RepID=UPI000B1B4F59
TQAAIAFSLMFRYSYMWLLVVLFVIKELFMGINGLILLKKGKKLDGAKWYGKVSTAVFYVATVALIAFPEMDITLVTILLVITSIFLSLSFIAYIPVFVKMYRS